MNIGGFEIYGDFVCNVFMLCTTDLFLHIQEGVFCKNKTKPIRRWRDPVFERLIQQVWSDIQVINSLFQLIKLILACHLLCIDRHCRSQPCPWNIPDPERSTVETVTALMHPYLWPRMQQRRPKSPREINLAHVRGTV